MDHPLPKSQLQISNIGQLGCNFMLWVTLTTNLHRPLLMTFLHFTRLLYCPSRLWASLPILLYSCHIFHNQSLFLVPVDFNETNFQALLFRILQRTMQIYISHSLVLFTTIIWLLTYTIKTSVSIAHPSSMLCFSGTWLSVIFNKHN